MIYKNKFFAIFFLIFCMSCTAEWDYPKVPQQCRGEIKSEYVYYPACHEHKSLTINTQVK